MARVYLDSCIVIYLIEGPESLSRQIHSALQPADSEPPALFFSDLTRLECRIGPLRKGDGDLLRQFDEFFASQDLQKLAFQTTVFDLATQLRAGHIAKTPDALHLAAAMTAGCTCPAAVSRPERWFSLKNHVPFRRYAQLDDSLFRSIGLCPHLMNRYAVGIRWQRC